MIRRLQKEGLPCLMEIGYLWLALSLFLFLITTGAAIVLAAVAFPVVRQADEERFPETFRLFRRRKTWSYSFLELLSFAFCILLSLYPPYSFPDRMMGWMAGVFGLLALTTLGSFLTSRKLMQGGHDLGLLRRLALLQWVSVMAWLGGSSALVYALVEVVGLV